MGSKSKSERPLSDLLKDIPDFSKPGVSRYGVYIDAKAPSPISILNPWSCEGEKK